MARMDLKKLKDLFFFKRVDAKPEQTVEEVCVFPLPQVVLLPGAVLPLHIFEERYKAMANELQSGNLSLAMSLAKPTTSGGDLAPSLICGAGKMSVLETYPDGRKDVFVEGRKRLKIIKFLQKKPYIRALAEQVPDIPFTSGEEESGYQKELSLLVKRWIFLSPDLQDQFINYVQLFTKPHHLADFIGHYFLATSDEKQTHLETVDRKKRVEAMIHFVKHRVNLLEEGPDNLHDEPVRSARVYH